MERELEKKQNEAEKMHEIEETSKKEMLTGNPLSNNQYSLNRKWHEETVFKNQARTLPESKKRFINDTVRSDFHRMFIARAIL